MKNSVYGMFLAAMHSGQSVILDDGVICKPKEIYKDWIIVTRHRGDVVLGFTIISVDDEIQEIHQTTIDAPYSTIDFQSAIDKSNPLDTLKRTTL